jgi:hypothetical protein
MDVDYDRCFAETELWEGGYSDDPLDPGRPCEVSPRPATTLGVD